MRKAASVLFLLGIVFSLTACKASKEDIKKADDFLDGLSAFSAADVKNQVDELVDLSARIIGLPKNSFDLNKDWYVNDQQHVKYITIFNSDGKLDVSMGAKVGRVSYTFCVSSEKDMYDAADNLIDIYGDPLQVYLNEAPSAHDAVGRATDSDNPDLTYSYVWKMERNGKSIYVYEAYYNANGTNFSYIVVCNYLEPNDTTKKKLWA